MRRRLIEVWLAAGLGFIWATAEAATLIAPQSTWHYQKGIHEASEPVGNWRLTSFDDASWLVGAAPFHYGENLAGGTVLGDMRNQYSCIYLRHSFDLDQPLGSEVLRFRAICDDGFIAWINGVEVARFNMPAGDRAFNSFASAAVAEPVSYRDYPLPSSLRLMAGRNVLAVQVFNNSITSSDLQWDVELAVEEPDTHPPGIASVEPAPGPVERLTEVVMTFTEPVTGVLAADLRLGTQPATAVTGTGSRYVFVFAQPSEGAVELRWDADTLITDLAQPANRFMTDTAGPWQYEVVDRTPPRLSEISPRPGLTVRNLAVVEISFTEPVSGIDATDLLANGIPAHNVKGEASGPYRFEFASVGAGSVRISWAINHGIHDQAGAANPLETQEWQLKVDPDFAVPGLRINEILTANVAATGFKDEDGELQDWIEIYNPGTEAANLDGWSLTDDLNDPDRWIFPSITLGPGQYLVVFASGKDRKDPSLGRRLHANFKLSSSGEYLALLNQESPRAVVSEFQPGYPEQRNDYSYGYEISGELRYFRTPTPGMANGASMIEGVAPPPHVNVGRGWFDQPFQLVISSPLPGVQHRFTTDGREPTETHGQLYTGPWRITTTTILRIASFQQNLLPSRVVTHTYLYAVDLVHQPNNPPGFPVGPTVMAGYPSDYEMDPEIVNDPVYRDQIIPALLSLPALSIVCPTEDLFGASTGIYTHPTSRGPDWERACSVEFIPNEDAAGFQTDAGIQIQGNAGREPIKQPKHAFRLVFKGDYGPAKLEFPLYPESPVSRFDTLVLRADFNFSWLHWNSAQRIRAQRTRDAWLKDSMRAMNGLASHNRYVHLFLNGLYWGIYDPSERPDAAFGASYMGGEKEDYDVINEGAAVDGSLQAYNAMLALSNLEDPGNYHRMQSALDLTQYIDYMLLHFYIGHQDWGRNKNWYALRPRDNRLGFVYVPWDGEMILDEVSHNRVSNADTPSGLHTALVANSEYRLAFADRVRKHLFGKGALTPAEVEQRWMKRAREIELAVIAETARWGDYRRDVHSYQNGPYELYTRDNHWRAEQNRLRSQYFPQRTATVLNQLRNAGLYPNLTAPEFSHGGGPVASGYKLSMSAPQGTVYFTTNDIDPRIPLTGGIHPSALSFSEPCVLDHSVRVKARAWQGGTWSALAEAEFLVDQAVLPVRITEIMYHPAGGDAHEFLELQNEADFTVDATGFWLDGVDFVFPHRTLLKPGEVVVLASAVSPSSFAARYPNTRVAGFFEGSLANSGERIALHDRQGQVLASVTYSDSGIWPKEADGEGYSLELAGLHCESGIPAHWVASEAIHGTPGEHRSPALPDAVRINEIEATASLTTGHGRKSDWIELANTGDVPISLGGWLLRDESDVAWFFPDNTTIAPRGFLVVWCDDATQDPGLHAPFHLDRQGETLLLQNADGKRVDAISYGPQVPGYTLGRMDTEDDWQLTIPTPEAPNTTAPLAESTSLKINEWISNPRPGQDDWLELHNADPTRPAALRNLCLANLDTTFVIRLPTFISPGGYLRLRTDDRSDAGHVGLRLPARGGILALCMISGQIIDQVEYTGQAEGISSGRWPDGGPNIVTFPEGPTPEASNGSRNSSGLQLSELLAAGPSQPGWIELYNPTTQSLDLSGFQLCLGSDGGVAWSFPAGFRLDPTGFVTIDCDETHAATTITSLPLNTGRSLSSSSGSVILRDPEGNLIDAVEYGFQIRGLSIGRTTGGWALLSRPSRDQANGPAAPLGSTKTLKINEWLASTLTGDDFIEVFNPSPSPVSLTGLLLSDDPALTARNRFQVRPLSYVAAGGWVAWKADDSTDQGAHHLNFRLDRLGEALRLYSPEGDLIDAIDFGLQQTGFSEGRLVDGGPDIGLLSSGPTPGRSNIPISENPDTDDDGLPDDWETAYGTHPQEPDADLDPDQDGLTNAEEFAAGTHPLDRTSRLEIRGIALTPSGIELQFHAVSNRTYRVLFQTELSSGEWNMLAELPAASTNRLQTVTDSSVPAKTRYYRLALPIPIQP